MSNPTPKHKPDERTRQQTEPVDSYHRDSVGVMSDYEIAQRGTSHMMSDKKRRSLITYNHITYFLYVISYFTAGLLWIVPIVMNYVKRHDADGSWISTHFDWQIKTFWYSIVWFILGIILIAFALGGVGVSVLADSGNVAIGSILLAGLGLIIMTFTFIWHLYRVVRGWIALTDNRPVP
ncbi:hypothetical protein AAJP47_09215 [Psychrobacter sp. B38]|uniref:DUF4870 family protein n=1 Tax=Psychrobacter sp. B38 TaxID=3143538 RepID=UPI0032103668